MFLLLCFALLLQIIVTPSTSTKITNGSVWNAIEATGSETFYKALQLSQYDSIRALLNSKQQKITFFLPTEDAIRAAKVDFNNTPIDVLLYHFVAGQHSSFDLLGGQQQKYLQTLSASNHSILIAGANPNNASAIQLNAGYLTANMVTEDVQCNNGIIHILDHFLQPPANTFDTVSMIDELQNYEDIIKSLNLTDIISGRDITLFAAQNDAWAIANGSSMAYGVLVHKLRYQVVHGSRLASDFVDGGLLETDYAQSHVTLVKRDDNAWSLLNEATGETANIVRTDIITSSGVIHIIDKVMNADVLSPDGRPGFYPNQTTQRKRPLASEQSKTTVLQANMANHFHATPTMAFILAFFTAMILLT